ncbi:hypothetical protein A1OE_1120 [Candidatus Endolissoclinum faulkneri L2]|uniref:Uncharacterized protein n=1 Tax=Candidatus Endolissoclinum faulkneri L2 TaxID=1193729 RepID=K7Z5H1_9PROT|nr:hypothetical protein A1OE_1120 [Candidatus Endolissoclinum faulkneri L2]
MLFIFSFPTKESNLLVLRNKLKKSIYYQIDFFSLFLSTSSVYRNLKFFANTV